MTKILLPYFSGKKQRIIASLGLSLLAFNLNAKTFIEHNSLTGKTVSESNSNYQSKKTTKSQYNITTSIKGCEALIIKTTGAQVCKGTDANILAEATKGTTEFRWYSAETGGILLAKTTNGSYTLKAVQKDTKIYVTAFKDGCESEERSLVSINLKDEASPLQLTSTKASINSCETTYVGILATGGEQRHSHYKNMFTTKEHINEMKLTAGDNSLQWGFASSTKAGGIETGELILATESTNSGETEKGWSITTPTIKFSETPKKLNLSFVQTIDGNPLTNNPKAFRVDVSIDGGTTWQVAWSIDAPKYLLKNQKINIDLSHLKTPKSIRLKYTFIGKGNSLSYWAIDDLLISSLGQRISWTPSQGLYTDSEGKKPYVAGEFTSQVYSKPSHTANYTAKAQSEVACETTASIEITVNTTETPKGEAIQDACSTKTLADLIALGKNIQWYLTPKGGNTLPLSTQVTPGVIYYASQTVDGCESEHRLAVKIDSCLAIDDHTKTKFNYYPNPVHDFVFIHGKEIIASYSILNTMSQIVLSDKLATSEAKINMQSLNSGLYIIQIQFENGSTKTIKIIKK